MFRTLFSKIIIPVGFAVGLAAGASAEDTETFQFGGDVFSAGNYVLIDQVDIRDAFGAGQNVSVTSEVDGNAHLVGRHVQVKDVIKGAVYAAGQDVSISAEVLGNATLFGQTVEVDEPISGNLRAFGQTVVVNAPIAGSAMIYGNEIMIAADISGDLHIGGKNFDIKDGVTIGGTLKFDEKIDEGNQGATDATINYDLGFGQTEGRSFWFFEYLKSLSYATFFVVLYAILFPITSNKSTAEILTLPGQTVWNGFLSLALTFGTVVVLMLSVIGIIVVPFVLVAALLIAWIGYLAAVFSLGTAVVQRFRDHDPERTLDRVIAAFVGVIIASIIVALPFVGFLAWWAFVLAGLGALLWPWMARKAGMAQG